jgi:Fe-S-cluster containining protein
MSAAEEFLCARCARHTQTCCQSTDIVVTSGDVARIADFTGRTDFVEFRAPANELYADQDDDPVWRDNVVRPDGTRRVLRQRPGGDCTFLGTAGCTLPPNVRPLICRLYPFDYTAEGIRDELARGCPVELLKPEQQLLQVLDMRLDDATRWHRQLYDGIVADGASRAASPDQTGFARQPVTHCGYQDRS